MHDFFIRYSRLIVAQINEDNVALQGTGTLSISGQQVVVSAYSQVCRSGLPV